ncbi:MAG: DUF4262 domain-containing protein [Actinobacteria bacterium]|nr:DUF4262 domain-containing protein [Actinomycetota bacterium]
MSCGSGFTARSRDTAGGLQYVGDGRASRSWCYSVGLAERFEHPELVVVGLEAEDAGGLLNAIGDLVRDGERLQPGELVFDDDGFHFHLSKVHPAHFSRGVFAVWVDYYRALGRKPLQAPIEVVPGGRRPRLDRANSPIGAPPDQRRRRPNRRRPRRR